MRVARMLTGVLAFLALSVLGASSAQAQSQVITICKNTIPAGGTGFSFVWQNGTSGPLAPFTLNDGQCQTFNVTTLDKFNRFTENVPAGWTLSSITCNNTTTPVWFDGADPSPTFQPGDNRVNMDLNEPQVTCVFTNTSQNTVPPMDVYAVKFVCGSFLPADSTNEADWPVKPGNYLTAINVHNPNRTSIFYRKKAVLLYRADKPPAPEEPQPPGELYPVELGPDWGVEVDCNEIRNKLIKGGVPSPVFIKGFVVFEVPGNPDPLPLDVTAVYTSHGWDLSNGRPVWVGFAEDIESVLPKRVK